MSNYCEFNISFKDLDLRTRCILFVKYLYPMLDIHSKTWKYSKLVKVYRILLLPTKNTLHRCNIRYFYLMLRFKEIKVSSQIDYFSILPLYILSTTYFTCVTVQLLILPVWIRFVVLTSFLSLTVSSCTWNFIVMKTFHVSITQAQLCSESYPDSFHNIFVVCLSLLWPLW